MPHINRVRVNNIKYNFGTQYYDDFLMRFSGKNTIYDLANGGGKSVLMLLLLQNMIPNCTLDEKQPIEKLFRTSGGSTTIHSLIEWRLSDSHVVDNYKYMLTGFCARKAKDNNEKEGAAAIEYFNYCIFYREFNDNDIKNLPLSNGKERITYNGLKTYLRELERKDLSLKIHIFERKGEYQRFIAGYGIYESEWEIVRGINKTEGHVRTYFESNYKTTRKVVEDLLIEEIIQKSFNNRTYSEGQEDMMAKTLLGIKDKLVDLLKSKDEILNYDRQMEVIEGFANRVMSVKDLYYGKDSLTEDIIRCYYSVKREKEQGERTVEELLQGVAEAEGVVDSYKREIATAMVWKEEDEKDALDNKLSDMDKQYDEIVAKRDKLKDELLLKENINNYIDYLYYKKERDALTVLLDNILKDKGELSRELSLLSYVKAKRDEAKKQDILETIEKEDKIIVMEEELIEGLRLEASQYNKENAVYEYLIKEYDTEADELSKKINNKRAEYDGVLGFDIPHQLEQDRRNYEQAESELSKLREESASKQEELTEISKSKIALREDIEENDNKLSYNIDVRSNLGKIEDKFQKLMQVYGEKNATGLKNKLDEKYKEAILELDAKTDRRRILKDRYDGLSNGCPIIQEKQVEEVYEYIVRYHGDIAVLGSEYIRGLSNDERREMLEKHPVLPYSILIKDKYLELLADTRLYDINETGYAIPLLRMQAIEKGEYSIDDSKMSFAVNNKELFYDEKLIEKQVLKTKEELSTVEFELSQIEETVELLKKDIYFVEEYIDVYMEQYQTAVKEYEELKGIRKEKEIEEEETAKKYEQCQKDIIRLEEKIYEMEERVKALHSKLSVMEAISEYNSELNAVTRKANEAKANYKNNISKYDNIERRLEAEDKQLLERKNYVASMKQDIKNMEEVFSRDYKIYYREDVTGDSKYNDEDLEVRFYGLKKAIEADSADVSDKKKLINNYDVAMDKSLMAIDYSGMFVDDIKALYNENTTKETSSDELKNMKKSIEELEHNLKTMTSEMSKLRTTKDKKEGSIEHAKKAIEEKYGVYEKLLIEEREYAAYVDSRRKELALYEEKVTELKEHIKDIEKEQQNILMLERDINKIITNGHINVGDEPIFFVDVSDIEEKIAGIIERNDKFLKAMYDKKEEFEKEKSMLIDTLKKLGAIPLAEEVRLNAAMPSNINDADRMAKALSEINECIALEKVRVLKSIEDMERIKDNFENQCIQTCINIKTELDRLPKLSKIFMDNETISIISMNIPYIKEENYKSSMEQYINDIVEMADKIGNETERLKYIKNQLSFKKLFSVIVTDMNAIKLNLYKRERIKEQSRYLRYEEAVGSTGQSQGIYIQFLIAVINYITSINSKNSEGCGLKKAIFIDNPFGAAKDIYIWEPIFKLLKTNNVQLIVPARGTTPAITGRFDVNYILGQKLVDGRQQTVVVDYCSNVDNEQMDYQTLTYEQTALF